MENAGRFVAEASAEVIEMRGQPHHARNIEAIVKAGIPVQGHIGITPMRMPQLGGFFAQGKRTPSVPKNWSMMLGRLWMPVVFSIMCEVTSEEGREYLREVLPVPVISLGAGTKRTVYTLSPSDLFHLYEEHTPRHSKIYTDLIRLWRMCLFATAMK